MHPLQLYYLCQAGRGLYHSGDRPCLYIPGLPTAWERHRLFFRQALSVGPTGTVVQAKAVGRETLRTGGKILTDIAENKSPEVNRKEKYLNT
jgi:hypothetical protein